MRILSHQKITYDRNCLNHISIAVRKIVIKSHTGFLFFLNNSKEYLISIWRQCKKGFFSNKQCINQSQKGKNEGKKKKNMIRMIVSIVWRIHRLHRCILCFYMHTQLNDSNHIVKVMIQLSYVHVHQDVTCSFASSYSIRDIVQFFQYDISALLCGSAYSRTVLK